MISPLFLKCIIRREQRNKISGKITKGSVILDVYGMWEPHKKKLLGEGVVHVTLGEKGWVDQVKKTRI